MGQWEERMKKGETKMVTGHRTHRQEREKVQGTEQRDREIKKGSDLYKETRGVSLGGRRRAARGYRADRGREESVRKQDRGREKGKKGEPA